VESSQQLFSETTGELCSQSTKQSAYPSLPKVNVQRGLSMTLISLKYKINTLKIAQAVAISASGEGQGCGDPTRTGTQICHKKEIKLRS